MFFRRIPCNWCVSSNYFVKLCFNKQHCVRNIITDFVEFSGWKSILTCSEKKRKLWRSFFEDRSYVISLLSDFTVQLKRKIRSGESSGSYRLSSKLFINIVKLPNFLQCSFNFSVEFFKLFFGKWSFKIFILFHENLWKYLIHIYSGYFVKLSLIDHHYEIVHFLWVPKVSCPYFEFDVFLLNLFDQICEEHLHFVLHGVELRDFSVGIFVKYVFNFTPFHFFTGFMKKSTFLFILESIFTNEARLTALRINTYHKARVSIDTLGKVFEMFACHGDDIKVDRL